LPYCNTCLEEIYILPNGRCPKCRGIGYSQFKFWARIQKWLASIEEKNVFEMTDQEYYNQLTEENPWLYDRKKENKKDVK